MIRNQYAALSSRIALESNALNALETRLTDAKNAAARRVTLQSERELSGSKRIPSPANKSH
jgi:hypothetical protein